MEPVVPCMEPADEGKTLLMNGQTQDYIRAGLRWREVWGNMWMKGTFLTMRVFSAANGHPSSAKTSNATHMIMATP